MEEINIMLYLGAITLGALHAFEPGHGKSVIAAYMIGTRGRAVDGILLGLIVTITHTFSVILLGILATLLSKNFTETQLHDWLGLVSAVLILTVGLWMLKSRISANTGHSHFHLFGKSHCHHDHSPAPHNHDDHDHNHNHDDHHHTHDHSHEHDHGAHSHPNDTHDKTSKWNLLLLGISGGLVPCPAGIATLLAAVGAGRIAQGLTVTVFFSLGLGIVMMSIGVFLSKAGKLTEKIGANLELGRKVGIISAAIITCLGAVTLFHSLHGILAT
ncbi:MAG: sulfite exporter TauE/SafE family protein [Proteobacteria bacterium]|nr:sulfite exporter TauE/SafE family protein [Pseudomonadota bacterium]MBU1708474.1 sulfite exporter TauE/SafE family protein [Pseudomonadota bacterium]